MVRGIDIFKKYFEQYADNYLIIGGTACDLLIDDAGLIPRATRDIDMILVIEVLNPKFVKQFWNFIREGRYEKSEINSEQRKYYRFTKPENLEFPIQIELFSRVPDMLTVPEGSHLTPIPVDEDVSSLSAILLDEPYYKFTLANSLLFNGIHIANTEELICLKAKAFLELTQRKAEGENIDDKKIKKHKNDLFRMVLTLSDNSIEMPNSIKQDLVNFTEMVKDSLPDDKIFEEMNASPAITAESLYLELIRIFQLNK